MKENNNSASGGLGFCSALAILFIGLKLGKVITWSWFWVLSPIWIPAAIAIGLLIFYVVLKILVNKSGR